MAKSIGNLLNNFLILPTEISNFFPYAAIIHHCMVEVLQFPTHKCALRCITLEKEDFYYPEGRSDACIILEILMIKGRTIETKKYLIRTLFFTINKQLSIKVEDIVICILESPAYNWGFRGKTRDEVALDYTIEV